MLDASAVFSSVVAESAPELCLDLRVPARDCAGVLFRRLRRSPIVLFHERGRGRTTASSSSLSEVSPPRRVTSGFQGSRPGSRRRFDVLVCNISFFVSRKWPRVLFGVVSIRESLLASTHYWERELHVLHESKYGAYYKRV